MTVRRSERFDADLERQFRWYLLETDLDPGDARGLATRFAEAVDAALEVLGRNPEIGRRRFGTYPDLAGTRSWPVRKPFHRFIIFYRIKSGFLSAERLLEGHRRLAAGHKFSTIVGFATTHTRAAPKS
jgi:plasmid stabilization system protein ParE